MKQWKRIEADFFSFQMESIILNLHLHWNGHTRANRWLIILKMCLGILSTIMEFACFRCHTVIQLDVAYYSHLAN